VNKALIDIDIFSELGKGVNQTVAGNGATYRAALGRYTSSVITVMEIIRGFQKKRGPRRLQAFLTNIASEEVLAFDLAAAELTGRIQGELERVGQPIGRAAPMIAATTLQSGLELVTGNTTHSQRTQQLGYPLVLVNWRI
jgi:tRNA(fMet)-specific endonuclease VapC